jgi:multiple sugar transport system permease protein
MKNNIVKWIIIIVLLLWTLIPFYWFIKVALQTPAETSSFPPKLYFRHPTIAGFFNVLGFPYTSKDGEYYKPSAQAKQVVYGLRNSFIVSTIVTAITIMIVLPLSYIFARMDFKFKNVLFLSVLFAITIPPVSTIIPFYILFVRLKLVGTIGGLCVITLIITVPFVTWMSIGFFRNLPVVEPLARIDGYSRLSTIIKIIIPMARTGILMMVIISFLFSWNEYTFAQVLVTGTSATTIPASVSGFLFQYPEPGHLAASVTYAMLPPFLVAFLLQKHIVKMNIVEPIKG